MNLGLLAPEFSLAATAIAVILLDLFVQRKGLLVVVSIAGIVVSAGFTLAMWGGSSQAIFSNMLAVDGFALLSRAIPACDIQRYLLHQIRNPPNLYHHKH